MRCIWNQQAEVRAACSPSEIPQLYAASPPFVVGDWLSRSPISPKDETMPRSYSQWRIHACENFPFLGMSVNKASSDVPVYAWPQTLHFMASVPS